MIATIVLGFIALLALVGAGAYGVILYNHLVHVKHNVHQAWANIDVLLKQRLDELTKLIDIVKKHMGYEEDLLLRLTDLRARAARGGDDRARLEAESGLSNGMLKLFAVAENYPQLKASESFLALEKRVSELEDQIAHRREYYNDAVNINNVRIEQLPDRWLASMAGLNRRPLFEASERERADLVIGDAFA
ncbi:MAG: LemA family protein [Planctomycetota bacterium]